MREEGRGERICFDVRPLSNSLVVREQERVLGKRTSRQGVGDINHFYMSQK